MTIVSLVLEGAVQGDDAATQVVHLDFVKAAFVENQLTQRLLIGMLANRLGQVLVAGSVARD